MSEDGFKSQILESVCNFLVSFFEDIQECEWVSIPRKGISKKGNLYLTLVIPVSQPMLLAVRDNNGVLISSVSPQNGGVTEVEQKETRS